MHFPRHWGFAKRGEVSAWGWSDESPEQARGQADARLQRILAWLREDSRRPLPRYGYPDRPMREPVLREFRDAAGTLVAAVTRNSYGCLVLNTTGLLFVDVDAPEVKASSFLAGLFGFRKPSRTPQAAEFMTALVEKARVWNAGRAGWNWRVYRTKAGVRLMASHQPIEVDDPVCTQAFEHFGADPLYRRLCTTQKCFRARLTPKPWRCGVERSRWRWPWKDAAAEAAFTAWDQAYLKAAAAFGTCQLIAEEGPRTVHPGLNELVELHDRLTRAAVPDLPLA